MVKQLKKITRQIIAGANIATIGLMLLAGFSCILRPTTLPILANIGLVFPVFFLANVGFLVFWLIFKPRWSLIPIAGLLLAYSPARTYSPINFNQSPPEDAIKILSYNVYFIGERTTDGTKQRVLDYIQEQDADIVCLQEIYFYGSDFAAMRPTYPYSDSTCVGRGGDPIVILSRYPILGKQPISYQSSGNHSTAFVLDIDGDTTYVVNNHLESTQLTSAERSNFNKMIKGEMKRDSATIASMKLAEKLGEATKRRAQQAEALAQFAREHKGQSIILCGDFNDSPLSYCHHTIARELTDCYRESGLGPGISYHENGFYVRIDHLFCSSDWQPFGCHIDSKTDLSDHYPLISWLKKRPKP